MNRNVMIGIVFLFLIGCGKTENYPGLTATGEPVTVPGTALPSNIPMEKCTDKTQSLGVRLPGFSTMFQLASMQGADALIIMDDQANVYSTTCLPGTFAPAEKLLKAESFTAQLVAARVKEPDLYFVVFMPLDKNASSWKKGEYAVGYQIQKSNELKVAFIDQNTLVDVTSIIKNYDLLKMILEASK